jgi:hypothetical protein
VTVPTHIKITFEGIFAPTAEIFTFSMKFTNTGGPFGINDADAQDVHLDQVETATRAFWNTNSFGTGIRVTEFNSYLIGPTGAMVGNPQNRMASPVITGTAAAGFRYPLQTSLCVTTVANNRGPARFGRFFLPQVAHDIDGMGQYDLTAMNSLLVKLVTWTKAVSDAVDIPAFTSGVSLANISSIGTGTMQVVDHLELGLRPDVMRSRANKIPESRLKSAHIDW